MKRMIFALLLLAGTALWVGCQTETGSPTANSSGADETSTAADGALLVKLSVPNMT